MASLLAATVVCSPVSAESNYCWKDSYGRGIGTIPTDCGFSEEKQGLLCYPACKDGYTGVLNTCYKNCPDGYTDNLAFCLKPAAYGRGAGYAWQLSDGFSNTGMLARCEAAEKRPCEMWGAVAYPTCKPGFHPFGSNVCTPDCPSDMVEIGVSCAKPKYWRDIVPAKQQVWFYAGAQRAVPSEFTTYTSVLWWTFASNTILLPSGDHEGLPAKGEFKCVSCTQFKPSSEHIQISDAPERVEENAIRRPSGEY
jgi:hypothetical protein